MFELIACVVGLFARSLLRCLVFAAIYLALYVAVSLAPEADAIRDGTAQVPQLLGALGLDAIVGLGCALLGHLCRRLLIKARMHEVAKTLARTFD